MPDKSLRTSGTPLEGRARFIEEMATLYERAGHPRMAGRLLGWMLICSPPHQTLSEIATALDASKASISTNARRLIDLGLIERFTLDDWRVHYRLLPAAWTGLAQGGLRMLIELETIAGAGRELVDSEPGADSKRLCELLAFCEFTTREITMVLGRWEQMRTDKE